MSRHPMASSKSEAAATFVVPVEPQVRSRLDRGDGRPVVDSGGLYLKVAVDVKMS
jgi:hypothetical protein